MLPPTNREAEERERLRLRRLRGGLITAPAAPVFRGAVAQLRDSAHLHEIMIAGPSETGKTYGSLSYLHDLLCRYPGASAAIVRKVRADMDASILNTWRRVLAARPAGVTVYGGNRPEWYRYPNGSICYIGGMDRPGKILSGERSFIYANQAEELALDDWQTLTTRATGRGSATPFTQVFGDCNPGPAHHWIMHRQALTVLHSRHEDNPALYDDAGQRTPQGDRTMAVLDALEGVLKERLRYGRWVSAEGAVYAYDAAIHQVPPFAIPASWRRIRCIDFGYRNAFVCLWIAIDHDGRMVVYRQLYMTGRLVARHADDIMNYSLGESIEATIADHDAEDRATLHAAGISTIAADKRLALGIQRVQQRLACAADGRPRLQVVAGCLVEADRELAARREPTHLEAEFDAYVWPKDSGGRLVKETPLDKYNHALDALRYGVMYVDGHGSRGYERQQNYLYDEDDTP